MFNNAVSDAELEHGMSEWRKRPVVVKAKQLRNAVQVKTLEGTMTGDVGDWLIKGVNGEFYPCKDDIFKKTYERV